MAVNDEYVKVRKQASVTPPKELSMTSSEVSHKYHGSR